MSEGALDGAEVLDADTLDAEVLDADTLDAEVLDADTLDAEVLDADAAFARLEELLALLPAIQAEDQRLTRARNARCLRQADARARYFEAQITQIETTRDQALLAGKKASDEGNAAEEGRHAGLARMCQELYYTRLHSMQKAQDERRDLLQQSDLTLEDPLDEYALADEEYEALEARIRDFQEEYQQLYALCLRLEGLE